MHRSMRGAGQLVAPLLPQELSAPVADSTTLLCENGEQGAHFIKLLIAQVLIPGTSSGGSQLPLSPAGRAGAN